MFSESISRLMSESSIKSAEERASQIESILTGFNAKIQEIKGPNAKAQPTEESKFAEILKASENDGVKYQVSAPNSSFSRSEINGIIQTAAKRYKIDDKLLSAVIKQESGFNPNAVSKCGAGGLMQLMPATAQGLGVKNLFDPKQNVMAGAKHLRGLLDRYKGNLILALAAYNSGGGNVDRYKGVPPFKETQRYVKNILSNYLNKTT